MTYRDDLDAATARRDALRRELASLQQRLHDHEPLQRRAGEVAAELEEANRQIAHARARVAMPLLSSVSITTPCHESWERMTGDEQVRFCGRCEKDVFNLSAMTAAQAGALLQERGDDMCVRFYRRPDGTVLTSDCPVGARRRRRRRLVVTAVAVAAGALGVAWMLTERDEPHAAVGCGAEEVAQPEIVEPEVVQPEAAPKAEPGPRLEIGDVRTPRKLESHRVDQGKVSRPPASR